MRLPVLALLLVAASLFSSADAAAQDITVYPCDGCTSTTYKNKALARGVGLHYFYNMQGRTIVSYEVFVMDEVNPGTLRAAIRTPPSWVIDEFAALLDFYQRNGNAWTGSESVSLGQASASDISNQISISKAVSAASGDTVDAYDVVGSSYYRNKVATHLGNSPRLVFTAVFASFGRAIRLAGIVTPDVPLTVHVNFPDGSKAIYKFNWSTKQFEYVKGSAVDSSGNNIPENASQASGGSGGSAGYVFNDTNDLNDWSALLTSYGVQIGGALGSPMVCAGSANTGVICRLDHK